MRKIFFLNPSCVVDEFAGLLAPNSVTSFVFSCKGSLDKFSYHVDNTHVRKIMIPKFGRGKFGMAHLPNFIDFVWHSFLSVVSLPYLLTYNTIIFKGPPFLDCVIMPVLRLFGKRIYLVSIDDQAQNIEHYATNPAKRLYYFFAILLEKIAVRQATCVFATAQYMVKKYESFGARRVVHTPNGADVEHLKGIVAKKYTTGRIITYMGGFEHWRGIDLLIDAFVQVQKKIKEPLTLLLIGGGPAFDEIKSKAPKNDRIIFTGYLPHDEGIAYCKGSDVLVMPSRDCVSSQTISSIKCFEYIACGVPTLVTDSGEHAHFVKRFNAGLVVHDTVADLAEGLHSLLTQKNLAATFKRSAKEHTPDVDYRVMKAPFREIVLGN